MASLKFIMDVNDDHQVPDRQQAQNNKKAKVPVKPATTGQLPEEPNPQPRPRHASSSGLAAEEDINPPPPTAPSKKRAASSKGSKSTTTATTTAPTALPGTGSGTVDTLGSSATLSTATTRPSVRRRSTTSTDSMERSGRYGSPASSSSIGGGLMRPMPNHSLSDTMPMRLTPITGRVSRAKKGVPVHVCELCKPIKTFTRAEHLRRHQLSHGEPQFRCKGCDKVFHRQDLLTRHQQKNEHGGEPSSQPAANPASPYPAPSPSLQQPVQLSGSQGSSLTHTQGSGQPSSTTPGPAVMPSTTTGLTGTIHRSYSQASDSPHSGMYGGASTVFDDYTMSPTTIVVTPSSGRFSNTYAQPRTTHVEPLSVITQGIQLPEQREPSPWASSATDSAYSTPVSESLGNPQHWGRSNPLLSPYPNPASRVSPGPGLGGDVFIHPNPYTTTSHNTQTTHAYSGGPMFSNAMGFGGPDVRSHQPSGLGNMQNQHGNTMTGGLRGLTPPPHTSAQANGTLIASGPTLHTSIDPSLSMARHKQRLIDAQLGGQTAMGNVGGFNDMSVGYTANGDVSPGGEMAGLNLELGAKYAMPSSMPSSMNIPLPAAIRAAIPGYLDVYWAKVHPVLPIVHRQSFEAEPEDVLRCAMAAVATQHLDTKEDRNRGNQLHEHAWQEAKRAAKWSLQIKQTILLCEYFARFRGRKPVTKPSDLFRHLYKRALCPDSGMLNQAMLSSDQDFATHDRWRRWVEAESCRRLLAACFLCDGHTAVYQQHGRFLDGNESLPLFGNSEKLWRASSADEWNVLQACDPISAHAAAQPEYISDIDSLTPEYVEACSYADRMVILGLCALRLPRRPASSAIPVSADNSPAPDFDMNQQTRPQQPRESYNQQSMEAEQRIQMLFRTCPIANTYLALNHTPLRDLLAVSGDSWAYAQKVLPATIFQEHVRRVRQWVGGSLPGLNILKATLYASRALLAFLDRRHGSEDSSGGSSASSSLSKVADISDYWALHVCALVCWAFNHGLRNSNKAAQQQQQQQAQQQHRQRSSSGGPSGGSSPASRTSGLSTASTLNSSDDEPIRWLRRVAECMRPEDVMRLRGHREAAGVVGLVKRQMENDCVGSRNTLYVDALGVLTKIEESAVTRRWF